MGKPMNLVFDIVLIVMALHGLASGSACTGLNLTGASDINMCKNGTSVVTVALLSASSAEMGDGTTCFCTMVAQSSLSNGSVFFLTQPHASICSAFLRIHGSRQINYSCNFSDNVFNLTCENNASPQSLTTPSSTGSGTSPVSTDDSFTVKRNVTSPLESATTTEGDSAFVSRGATTITVGEPPTTFPVIPVAAGVAGASVFLLTVIVVVVVVILFRRRRRTKRRSPSRMSKVPVPPDIPLEDNILYEPSSVTTAGEAPKTGGATQPVKGGAGGGGTSGQTSGHLGRDQYLGPAGDVYSLVQKAGEDGGPGHLQSAQLHSTPGLASTEVIQGDADHPALGSSLADNNVDPCSLQSSSAPDVEHSQDLQGVVRSSPDGAPSTAYTAIDPVATKNLSTVL